MNDSEIFITAVQIDDLQVRSAFLESVCKGSIEQRRRIEKRIEQYESWQGAWDGFSSRLAERFIQSVQDLESDFDDCDKPSRDPLNPRAARSECNVGLRVGAYEILSCLGMGGMGEVYLAHDERLNRKVALKLLPLMYTQAPKWLRRFEREAKAASALNHPNIMTIYEVGRAADRHYIASEFVDGQTLRTFLGHELSLDKKLDVAIQIAEALNMAHSSNIIHRDIKPENVMVRRDGLVKVLDFGIAKQIIQTDVDDENISLTGETDPGLLIGTIRYMSPEQAHHMPVDFRADLFSFGLIIFELLTRTLPYKQLNDATILMALMSDEPIMINHLPASVPAELEWIVEKLLRKDRDERYQSAKEILVDLKRLRRQSGKLPGVRSVNNHSIEFPRNEQQATGVAAGDETCFDIPEIRYARSGQVNIAYQILGKGSIDLVFVPGWISHLDWIWKEPSFVQFLRHLASIARLILFDKRGTGLSDRVTEHPLTTLPQRMDDLRAVMEAAGSDRAVLCGVADGGSLCSLFAATYPQQSLALVLVGSYARRLQAPDYPWGDSDRQHAQQLDEIAKNWGGPIGIEAHAASMVGDLDFCHWWATYLRIGASPGAALTLSKMNAQIDIRSILHSVQVPTLVIHRTGDRFVRVEQGRHLAEHIPGSKFVEMRGADHAPFVGNQDEILDTIAEFLTGVKPNEHPHRVLATIMCAKALPPKDIGISSEAQRLGLSQAHFVREIDLFRGRTLHSAPRQISASFDAPARAIRAAIAVRDSAVRLGVDLQVGLHIGECEVHQDRLQGPAVQLAERIARHGNVNEIVVSSTVKDLVAGSGIKFVEQEIVCLDNELPQGRLFQVKS